MGGAGTDFGLCSFLLNPVLLTPTISDNCNPSPALTYTLTGATTGMGSGVVNVPLNKGTTTITYTVDDGVNPTASCMLSFDVYDYEEPVIGAIPADQNLSTSTMSCDQDFTWNHPTVTDNCPGPYTLSFEVSGASTFGPAMVTPGDPITFTFDKGVSTITYIATDAGSNTSSATFAVTVVDDVAPEVTQLPLILSPPYQSAYVVDADPGSCNKTVQWYRPSQLTHDVIDNCGGPVRLVEGPAIINGTPDPAFLTGIAPAPYDPLDFYDPTYILFWLTPVSASFPIGTTIIPYYLYDDENNESVIQITVTVNETQPPTALCAAPGTVTVALDNAGAASITPAMINNGSTDNCGIDNIAVSPTSFNCTQIGLPQTVTLTVEDFAGNTATCTTTINVIDNIAPVVQCPNSVTVSSNPMTCTQNVPGLAMNLETVLANLGPGEYYDNSFTCGFPMLHREYSVNGGPFTTPFSGLSAFLFYTGVNNVTIRVKDKSNNFGVCSFTVTVQDLVAPVYNGITGQAAGSTITVNANLGGCLAVANWEPPQFDEMCSLPVTITSSHMPGSFFLFGNTVVTYTATDAAGNVRTHSFNVNIVDTQNPVAKCKDITVSLNSMGMVTVLASAIDDGSTDNCFFDYTIPSYAFNCGNLGANTRMMTIVDGQGNTASCNAVITVVDDLPPTAVCASIPFVDLDANGVASLSAMALNGGSTDNCPASLTYTLSVDGSPYAPAYFFSCDDLGIRTVILRVTDGGGNTAECFQNIQVRDVTPPSFTVPTSRTVNCEDDQLPPATGAPTDLNDRCDPDPSINYFDSFAGGSCANEYVITRTWIASDASGNTATATQTITVVDDTAPAFSMNASITLNTDDPLFCDGDGVFVAQVTADSVSDNCAPFSSLTISHSIEFPTPDYGYSYPPGFQPGNVPFSHFPIGTTTVTWRAVDACNNSRTFVQTITVRDTQAPVFSYAQCGVNDTLVNTTGSCSNLYTWIRPVLGADVFECAPANPATISETVSNPSVQNFLNVTNPYNQNGTPPVVAQFPIGTTTVTYTATDAAMNVSTCSFTVTIVDNEAPVVTCPANQTLNTTCETGAVPNYKTLVQVQDNCPNNLALTQNPPQGTLLTSIFGGQPPTATNSALR